jgi:hypothetical protein
MSTILLLSQLLGRSRLVALGAGPRGRASLRWRVRSGCCRVRRSRSAAAPAAIVGAHRSPRIYFEQDAGANFDPATGVDPVSRATAFAYRTDQADVIAWILAHAGDEADEITIVSI